MNIMEQYYDLRPTHKANNIQVQFHKRVYYAGMPVDSLELQKTTDMADYYDVISKGLKLGSIILSHEDSKEINYVLNRVQFKLISGSYVCHYLRIANDYSDAIRLAKGLQPQGKKYHSKRFGGGIAFDCSEDDLINLNKQIQDLNA